jgi:trans-aconitate 2-methyltransferase
LKYDWDATAYDHISYIQESWGYDIIKSRKCKGNEIVLDAGCGSARLTKILSIK